MKTERHNKMTAKLKRGRPKSRPDSKTLEALNILSREEVAQLYNVSASTVRSWYTRDRKERVTHGR
ncbi:helix-turn-helix domain-containing protein [Lactococcus lactis]